MLKTTNKKTIISAEILPYDKRSVWLQRAAGRWGKCCWPQWCRGLHPFGDSLGVMLCPEDPDHSNQAEKRSGSCSFIWLSRWSTAAVRSEKRRAESAEVKPPQQGMAQIEVLPHRHPARYLNHISQAWKDSPCSPQDRWRWTSSREADEMQVKKNKRNQAESYNFSALFETKAKTFCLHAATWARSLINPRCLCLWGVKSEGSCPLWPRGSAEPYRLEDPRDLTALSHKIRCCIYSVAPKFKS